MTLAPEGNVSVWCGHRPFAASISGPLVSLFSLRDPSWSPKRVRVTLDTAALSIPMNYRSPVTIRLGTASGAYAVTAHFGRGRSIDLPPCETAEAVLIQTPDIYWPGQAIIRWWVFPGASAERWQLQDKPSTIAAGGSFAWQVPNGARRVRVQRVVTTVPFQLSFFEFLINLENLTVVASEYTPRPGMGEWIDIPAGASQILVFNTGVGAVAFDVCWECDP